MPKHERDPKFPLFFDVTLAAVATPGPANTPRRLAICKHCRTVFAGEIDEFGEATPDGVCPARGLFGDIFYV